LTLPGMTLLFFRVPLQLLFPAAVLRDNLYV